ncbi:MFS transporter [Streptomyces sp. XM4193]|uniref:MFS transporter n=1 Tax=Streptomyces sp. XM4193 TaxID=2929782 RepID=UPI001FFBB4CC|nr:MFS transporter [Streptomyces sp. XM4193]MCK1794880.1 MFS transporter [Streptomyces sp. XM4193]
MRIYLRLLGRRRFGALCLGQAVSLVGDALFPILVVVAAAESGTPAETIGAVFAARFLALGGVVLFSGALLDRLNPVTAAVAADSSRVVALLVLALFWGGRLDALVLVVAVLVGLCEAVSEPALLLIAPRTVGRPVADESADPAAREVEVTAIYGLLEGMRNIAGIAGPSIAAGLVAALSPSAGAVAAAIAFGVSAVATRWAGARWTQSRRTDAAAPDADGPGDRKSDGQSTGERASDDGDVPGDADEPLWRTAVGGLAALWRVRWLRQMQILAVVHVLLAVGPWMVALPVLVIERGHSASVYAVVLGAFAAGTVAGALLGGRITGPRRGLYSLALLALFGLTAMSLVLTDFLPLVIAAFVVGGVGQQAFDVVKMAGLRRDVPESLHGRAFSADFFFSFASLPLGQAIGALLLRFVSAENIMLWAGVLVVVTSCAAMAGADARRFASGPLAPDPARDAVPRPADRKPGESEALKSEAAESEAAEPEAAEPEAAVPAEPVPGARGAGGSGSTDAAVGAELREEREDAARG